MLIKYSYYNITLAAHPAGHLSAIDQQKKETEKGEMDPNHIPTPILPPKYAT